MPDQDATAEFRHRLAALRFSPSDTQQREMQDAFPHLARMLARLPDELGFADEPASAFTADALPSGGAA